MFRLDFVSNSSSSSYLFISNNVTENDIIDYKSEIGDIKKVILPTNKRGSTAFGWDFVNYIDFWSKMNFCSIQLYDLKHYGVYKESFNPKYYKEFCKKYNYDRCFNMFKKVCLEKFNLDVEIKEEYDVDEKYDYYIDHQSSITEGRNMEMFDDENSLYKFLGSLSSYVCGGNDNDGGEYYD